MAAASPVIVNEFGEVGIDHHLRHERFVFHYTPKAWAKLEETN
jgi:G3E family GTPase